MLHNLKDDNSQAIPGSVPHGIAPVEAHDEEDDIHVAAALA